MSIFSFFKKQYHNIFIDINERRALDIKNKKVDYVLSRSLYSSIPPTDDSFYDYHIASYPVKKYIDTYSSFIDTPSFSGASDEFLMSINRFIEKEKTSLLSIYRQSMIDGLVYVLLMYEKEESGGGRICLKPISRDLVVEKECLKKDESSFSVFTFQYERIWHEGGERKTCKVKVRVSPFSEEQTVTGCLPPDMKNRFTKRENRLNFVPVFALTNNTLAFLQEGAPEVAPLLPFLREYNLVFSKIQKHLSQILDPKIKLHLQDATAFLKHNFALKESDFASLARGEWKPDVTQFKAAILQEKEDDVAFLNQDNHIDSALQVLNLLHWIIIELTMPEYLYGLALNTTNASVKEQSPSWRRKIEDKRGEYSRFYYWLAKTYLHLKNDSAGYLLYEKSNLDELLLSWPSLNESDKEREAASFKNFSTSLIQLVQEGLISPKSAFNELRTFLNLSESFESEKEEAMLHLKQLADLEAYRENLASPTY